MSDKTFCDWYGCDKQLTKSEEEEGNWFRDPDIDFCSKHWKEMKKLLRPRILD